MKHVTAMLSSLVSMVCLAGAACVTPEPEPSDSTAAPLEDVTLTCKRLVFAKGSAGSGQSVDALATRDLSGRQDVWSKYVELSRGADATCSFAVPTGTTASSLSLVTNYRGPAKREMVTRFSAWDFAAGAWVLVGDNRFASDWIWSAATLPLPAPASRFVSSSGELRIRYAAGSKVDVSQLDQLVLVASSAPATTTPEPQPEPEPVADSGAMTDGGSTTTEPTTPPPTTSTGIWKPTPGTSWQWQLSGTLDTSLNVKMYDLDLFDTPAQTIAALRARGIKVICYFSAGSYEKWRPDVSKFPASVLGNTLDGWPDERWLDIRSATVRSIMASRMDLAVQKGCDGVEPDNVDGYTNRSGFPLSGADQLDYNAFLASAAHARSLSIALKNDLDQVKDLVSHFDFAVNEECFRYSECGMLAPFINANKAVFQVEYVSASQASTLCPKANAANLDTLIKRLDLDAWRISCR